MASLIDALHIAITIYHLSVGILNFSNQLLESGSLCTHKSIHEWDSLAKSYAKSQRLWSQRHHTQRCTKTSQTPNLQNVTQAMTIHDHPMMRMEKDSPRSATKQKRRTVQHLRKISCRCTSPRPRACRAWIQIANPKSMAKLVTLTVTTPMSIHPSSCFLAPFFPLVFSRYRQVFFQVFFEFQC